MVLSAPVVYLARSVLLQVGILDVDLCGPSIPHMLNVRSKHVHQCDAGWVPVYANPEQTIAVMSIGFLLENPDDAVVWRGPKKTGKGNLAFVQHIVLVLSGKGGVGKSTITTELALALRHAGKKVGILDVDLCGPSIPHMLNVRSKHVHQCDAGWVPVYANPEQTIAVMSIGFLLENPDDAVVWRGPKKTALIKQFVSDVAWGELDYLIVDTPPGTSDEHLAVVESLRGHGVEGAVLVTTPQAVSTGDVRREITFSLIKQFVSDVAWGELDYLIVDTPPGTSDEHLAVVESLRGHGVEGAVLVTTPQAVSTGDVRREITFWCVPLDPQLSSSLEEGGDFIQAFPLSATFSAINEIAQKVMSGAAVRR
ncbi:UNVERIFIED_CONTAM: hypothetical protein FKN15_064194 [Acipenser sinensis]